MTALQFIPDPDSLLYLEGINRIRADNGIEHLRWVTLLANMNDMRKTTSRMIQCIATLPDDAIRID